MGLKNPRHPLDPAAVAEVQGPLLRIFQDFPVCISLVYTEEMEVRKEKRRKGRLEYRTPYAMRRHKAWRGGSKAPQTGESDIALPWDAYGPPGASQYSLGSCGHVN